MRRKASILHKIKTEEILICIFMIMQLGFQTNLPYDEDISLIVTIAIGSYFLAVYNPKGKISLNYGVKVFVLWYLIFSCICVASLVTGRYANFIMLKKFVKETLIPVTMAVVVFGKYINNINSSVTSLLEILVYAEVITCIRVLVYTPLWELISTMNPTLYGENMGVNYNAFTTPMALVLCVVLYLNIFCKKKLIKSAVFIIINLVLSGSRKAVVGALISALLLYIMKTDRERVIKKIKRFMWIVIVIVGIIVIVYTNSYLRQTVFDRVVRAITTVGRGYESLQASGMGDASSRVRSILREQAWLVFQKHPIFGVGYYGFTNFNQWNYYAHNNMLDILANLGIVGFLEYYWYYVYEIHDLFKIRKENKKYQNSLRPDILLTVFFIELLIIEYGQVLYFRIFGILPILTIIISTNRIRMSEKNF